MNMNFFNTTITRNFKIAALAILSGSALLIQSCSKDNTPVQEFAFINITNAAPTTGTFNIYVDQNKINTGGAVSFGGTTGYMQALPGTHNVKFTTASSTESLISKDITLEANTVSSLFLIGSGANLDYLKIKDELGSVTSAKAFVRFINLSPTAPTLNLAVKDGEAIITDKAYKASSAFIEIEPKAYVFALKDKTNGNTLSELASIELKAGKSYTVIATGLLTPGGTEQPFGGRVITNQ